MRATPCTEPRGPCTVKLAIAPLAAIWASIVIVPEPRGTPRTVPCSSTMPSRVPVMWVTSVTRSIWAPGTPDPFEALADVLAPVEELPDELPDDPPPADA